MTNLNVRLEKDYILWLELVLLTLLCAAQFMGLAVVNLLLTAGVGCVILFAGRIEHCALALFMALPMFNLFNVGIGSTSLFYLFVFLFWFRYVQNHGRKLSTAKLLILMAFLLLRLTSGDLVSTAKGFVLFSVLVLTYGERFFTGCLGKLVFYVTLSFLISSLFGYLMLETGRSIYLRGHVYVDGVTTIRFAGLIGDSVFYSQCCALLVSANLTLGCCRKQYLPVAVLLSTALTGFCLLTYAKTGLFLVAGVVVIYVLWLIYDFTRRWATLPYVLLLLAGCVGGLTGLGMYLMSGEVGAIVENYAARFHTGDLLTGRLTVWKHYTDLLAERWQTLICAMPQELYSAVFTTNGVNRLNRAHNIYIETVCAFGLLATEAVLIWLCYVIFRFLRRGRQFLCLIPLGVMLASGMVLHGHFDFHYYFLVAIALCFLNWNQKRDRFALR